MQISIALPPTPPVHFDWIVIGGCFPAPPSPTHRWGTYWFWLHLLLGSSTLQFRSWFGSWVLKCDLAELISDHATQSEHSLKKHSSKEGYVYKRFTTNPRLHTTAMHHSTMPSIQQFCMHCRVQILHLSFLPTVEDCTPYNRWVPSAILLYTLQKGSDEVVLYGASPPPQTCDGSHFVQAY